MLRYLGIGIALLVALTVAPGAGAEAAGEPAEAMEPGEVQVQAPEKASDWDFGLALYAWGTIISQDIKKGPIETSASMSISDVLDVIDFAAFLHFEARKDEWGLFSDLIYAKLGGSGQTRLSIRRFGLLPKVDVASELRQTIFEFGGYRRFGGDDQSFDLMVGGRYVRYKTDTKLGPLRLGNTLDWTDPFVGGRYMRKLADKWQFATRADIGGFGAGSDFSVNGVATFRYQMSPRTYLGFGYRVYYFDYESGGNELKNTTHGPLLGVGFRF